MMDARMKRNAFSFSFVVLGLLQSSTGCLLVHQRNQSTVVAYDTLVPTLIHASNPDATLFDPYLEFNATGSVTVLDRADVVALKHGNGSWMQNKIVIVKLALMDDLRFLCGTKTDYWEEHVCSISRICKFQPKAVIQELYASSWFYPKRWLFSHGKRLLKQYNISDHCNHFRSYGQFLDETKLQSLSGLTGEVVVEDSAVEPLRSHYDALNVIFFRVVSTVGYTYLTGIAGRFALYRYHFCKLNSVYILLYAFNGITCAVLAFTYALGPFFLFDIAVPQLEQLQFATYDTFLGVNCATDYLSTILYVHSTAIISSGSRVKSADKLWLQYPIMFTVGTLTALTNIASAFVVSNPYISIALVVVLIPIIEGILQFGVLIYVLRHVSSVTQLLRKARLDFNRKEVPDARIPVSLQLQIRLEKQMRFWVKVSAFGTSLTLLCTMLLYGLLTSPLSYRVICGMGTCGKQVNVLGQLMISKPAVLHQDENIKVLYKKSQNPQNVVDPRSYPMFSAKIHPTSET